MATHKWSEIKNKISPERRSQLDATVRRAVFITNFKLFFKAFLLVMRYVFLGVAAAFVVIALFHFMGPATVFATLGVIVIIAWTYGVYLYLKDNQ